MHGRTAHSLALDAKRVLASSRLAQSSLLAARVLVPAVCLYGATSLWFVADGDSPLRRAAVAVAALTACAEAAAAAGARAAAAVAVIAAGAALGASVGGLPPFWQFVCLLAVLLGYLWRFSVSCCGRDPACCCACACGAARRADAPARRRAPPRTARPCIT